MSTKVEIDWYIKFVLTNALDMLEGGLVENPDTAIQDAVRFRRLSRSDAAVNIADRLRAIDSGREAIEAGDYSSIGVLTELMNHIMVQTGREMVEAGYVDLHYVEQTLILAGRVAIAKAIIDAHNEGPIDPETPIQR